MSDIIKNLGEEITQEVRRQLIPQIVGEIQSVLRGEIEIAYTEAEAAEVLKMTPRVLADRRRSGAINYRKDGNYIVYTLADLMDYLERIEYRSAPARFEIVPRMSLIGPKVQQLKKVS